MLNFHLSPEQIELKAKARAFALEEILPVAWYYDEADATPVQVLEKAFHAGIMNSDIPKAYGGKGYGLLESALLTEEIAAACPGFATSIFDNSLGMEPLILSDNENLKKKYLTEIATRFKLICFATSEPTMGSDVSGIRCKAERDGDGETKADLWRCRMCGYVHLGQKPPAQCPFCFVAETAFKKLGDDGA